MSLENFTATPYTLLSAYEPGLYDGAITFPNHITAEPGANPNLLGTIGHAVYINTKNLSGDDYSTEFRELTAQSFTMSIKQNDSEAIYNCYVGSFEYGDVGFANVYFDSVYGIGANHLPTLVKAASADFNTEDAITLTFTNRTTANSIFDKFAYGDETGLERFLRLRLLGNV